MDVDLQDPPELILDFLRLWREGYDVVFGVRVDRNSDTAFKRTTAKIFYRFFNSLTKDRIPEDTGDFRLMDRRVVEALRRLPERNRFMKGLFAWVGFRSVGVPYTRRPRGTGDAKIRVHGLWRLALDGITSFSTLPLRIWTYVGFVVACLALLFGVWQIVKTLLTGVDTPGLRVDHGGDSVPRRRSTYLFGSHRRISWSALRRSEAASVVSDRRGILSWLEPSCSRDFASPLSAWRRPSPTSLSLLPFWHSARRPWRQT